MPSAMKEGIYMLTKVPPSSDPSKPDSIDTFNDDNDYDDGGPVTDIAPENQASCLTAAGKVPSTSGSRRSKGRGRIHIIILYVLVAICFLMWTGLLMLVLSKFSQTSDELLTMDQNNSERLMRMKKDLDYVQTMHRVLEKATSNKLSELQDITESFCHDKPSTSYTCPAGWMKNENNCYYFSSETKIWTNALLDCLDKKSYLVSIWSDEEQGFLKNSIDINNTYWLGMTNLENEGKWRWKEGDMFISTAFWDLREKHQNAEKACGIMKPTGFWAAAQCSDEYRWICKRRLIC